MASWLIALVVGPLFAPKLLDNLQIDEKKLQWSDGFWWDEEERIIQYDTVASVRKERRMRLRIRVMIRVFQMRDGSVNEVAILSFWEEHHEEIEVHFRAKSIQITRP